MHFIHPCPVRPPSSSSLRASLLNESANELRKRLSVSEQEFVYPVSGHKINRFVAFGKAGAIKMVSTPGDRESPSRHSPSFSAK